MFYQIISSSFSLLLLFLVCTCNSLTRSTNNNRELIYNSHNSPNNHINGNERRYTTNSNYNANRRALREVSVYLTCSNNVSMCPSSELLLFSCPFSCSWSSYPLYIYCLLYPLSLLNSFSSFHF